MGQNQNEILRVPESLLEVATAAANLLPYNSLNDLATSNNIHKYLNDLFRSKRLKAGSFYFFESIILYGSYISQKLKHEFSSVPDPL